MQQSSERCKIIVDAMGGDYAPENAVIGAVEAANENSGFDLFLVGIEKDITKVLKEKKLKFDTSRIINAPEVIEMGDSPTDAIKKKPNASIVIGSKYVKEKKAHAFVSAGNTGAMMAASTLIMGRLKNVGRPTIGAEIPNVHGTCHLFDVGAGKDAKPVHLFEYAVMGSIYAKELRNIPNPKVGILSMGEEESKGNEVTTAAFRLLKESKLNFVGNVEGRDILTGNVDVVVCDGFIGNILLKFGESVPKLLKHLLKQTADKNLIDKIKIGLFKSTLKRALKSLDYQEHGGVPLLGVNGISIIGHGSSTPKAIKNMVFRAYDMYKKDLNNKIENSLTDYLNIVDPNK
ncbi:MAG: phosphate acyltransferase PlsX [Ignavibacteriaceae bacterium]|nr:phosphate acyltransferase PlsX [Ignavibacteriaceae bacterium]